jgi:HEAT repeat protein
MIVGVCWFGYNDPSLVVALVRPITLMQIQTLQQSLNHSDEAKRHKALSATLALGNHEAYGLLMYAAHNHFSPETRAQARKASLILQKSLFGEPSPKESQFSEQENDLLQSLVGQDTEGLKDSLKVLAQSENSELLTPLVKILNREQNPENLPLLILTCAKLGKEAAAPYITSYLRSGNEGIRASVIRGLAAYPKKDTTLLLVRFALDPSARVRKEALRGLNRVPADQLSQCFETMSHMDDPFHKEALIYVIAKLAFEAGLPLLEQLKLQGSDTIREKASQALKAFESHGVSPDQDPEKEKPVEKEVTVGDSVQDVLQEESPEVNEEEGGPNIAELDEKEDQCLSAILQGEAEPAVRAIFSLIEISRLSRLEEIPISILERGPKKVLASLAIAMAQSKNKVHTKFLSLCLEDKDGRVQANAIEALRMLGCLDQKKAILPFLSSTHPRTRANAVLFLHPTGLVDTASELTSMLASRSDHFKLSAIFAIIELFEPELIPLLDTAMDSPNPKVSNKAIDALKMFVQDGHTTAIELAKRWNILEELSFEEPEEQESGKGLEEGDSSSQMTDETKSKQSISAPLEPAEPKIDTKGNPFKKGLSKIKGYLKNLNSKK